MRVILSLFISTMCLVAPPSASAQVRIHGAPDTFGSLSDMLSSGHHLSKIGDAALALPPGRTPFFMASTSDGTVFAATFHQNGNNLLTTSCYMAIMCLNPTSPVCYDESEGRSKNFSTIYVKTRDGYKVPDDDETACLTPSTTRTVSVSGPDVTDIETVIDERGTEHVVFMSTLASLGNHSTQSFPALGFVSKISGAWRLNPAKQYWRDQIAAASPIGALVCPGGNCHGFGEMAFLPASRRLAIGFYFGTNQALAVFDLNGVALASHSFANPGNRCTPDPGDILTWVGTRQVDVDPTGVLGNERIVITTDASSPFSHPIQEYKYDDTNRTLAPVTNFVTTVSGSDPLADCTPQGQNANYDKYGNMVVGAYSAGRAVYHVYLKDRITGKRSIEERCPFTGYTEENHARGCMADLSVGEFSGLSTDGQPRWTFPFHNSNTQFEPRSSILARLNGNAGLSLLDEFLVKKSPVYVSYRGVALDANRLPTAANVKSIVAWKGTLQPATQSFWIPLATTLFNVDKDCTGLCERYTNERHPGWFSEVKYNDVMNGGFRVRGIVISGRGIRKHSPRVIKFKFKTNRNVTLDAGTSGFWLFPMETGGAVHRADVLAGNCSAVGCTYTVQFAQNAVQHLADGVYRWSAVLKGTAATDVIHAQGVIKVSL